ncbi:GIY-YIG nuclease family protein [Enterococcus sp. AZ109]|uniref:GIY-YIG nuclease family protein n=1 Tax=Enterococcus sp. AZ109 TaxID=2774634 RepID=UPI003F26438D
MAMSNHYFYVLSCRDNSYYGGYTVDLTRRLSEHNSGKGAKYTHPAKRRPVAMIHAEMFNTRSDAMKAEAAFKRLPRFQKDKYLKEHHKKSVL